MMCSIVPLHVAFPWEATASRSASDAGSATRPPAAAQGMPDAMMFLAVLLARSILRPRIPLKYIVGGTFPVQLRDEIVVEDWNRFHRNLAFSDRVGDLPEE